MLSIKIMNNTQSISIQGKTKMREKKTRFTLSTCVTVRYVDQNHDRSISICVRTLLNKHSDGAFYQL